MSKDNETGQVQDVQTDVIGTSQNYRLTEELAVVEEGYERQKGEEHTGEGCGVHTGYMSKRQTGEVCEVQAGAFDDRKTNELQTGEACELQKYQMQKYQT